MRIDEILGGREFFESVLQEAAANDDEPVAIGGSSNGNLWLEAEPLHDDVVGGGSSDYFESSSDDDDNYFESDDDGLAVATMAEGGGSGPRTIGGIANLIDEMLKRA